MRFDPSKRELRLVEFAIVQTDEFWAPQGDEGWKLEDQTARRVLDKIRDAYERSDRGKAREGEKTSTSEASAWNRR